MIARDRHEIEALRRAGQATARLQRELVARARPGVRTRDLNDHALAFMARIGAEPVFTTQNKFPGAINTSINDEAVHGIPGDRILQAGDLLKIDCGMALDGFCGDATVTIPVGPAHLLDDRQRKVMVVAREALKRGIDAARAGNTVGDIGHAMQTYVEAEGCNLLHEYTGHSLGRRLWEEPKIPSVGQAGQGPVLEDGLVITIEPIVCFGSRAVRVAADRWTVLTRDGAPVSQFEHTVLVTRRGARILTQP
jgi:methionyl aminopeptidase